MGGGHRQTRQTDFLTSDSLVVFDIPSITASITEQQAACFPLYHSIRPRIIGALFIFVSTQPKKFSSFFLFFFSPVSTLTDSPLAKMVQTSTVVTAAVATAATAIVGMSELYAHVSLCD